MFSKIVRRTHMYLALFLTPWVLMYALSTIAMNHRDFFRGRPHFEKEREQVYAGAFAPGAKPREMAAQILRDLGLDGAHNVNAPSGGGRVVITRLDPLSPRRLTFTPADSK
ncbi:MAG: hypothetical protein HY238_11800, partial [Acidobacteria bacterium]|nr:hypothetical protein [Acidobacteriota bacterium]